MIQLLLQKDSVSRITLILMSSIPLPRIFALFKTVASVLEEVSRFREIAINLMIKKIVVLRT